MSELTKKEELILAGIKDFISYLGQPEGRQNRQKDGGERVSKGQTENSWYFKFINNNKYDLDSPRCDFFNKIEVKYIFIPGGKIAKGYHKKEIFINLK